MHSIIGKLLPHFPNSTWPLLLSLAPRASCTVLARSLPSGSWCATPGRSRTRSLRVRALEFVVATPAASHASPCCSFAAYKLYVYLQPLHMYHILMQHSSSGRRCCADLVRHRSPRRPPLSRRPLPPSAPPRPPRVPLLSPLLSLMLLLSPLRAAPPRPLRPAFATPPMRRPRRFFLARRVCSCVCVVLCRVCRLVSRGFVCSFVLVLVLAPGSFGTSRLFGGFYRVLFPRRCVGSAVLVGRTHTPAGVPSGRITHCRPPVYAL